MRSVRCSECLEQCLCRDSGRVGLTVAREMIEVIGASNVIGGPPCSKSVCTYLLIRETRIFDLVECSGVLIVSNFC